MKKVDNENIKINYQKNNNDIVLASYELINKDEKSVKILFIGFEDLKYFLQLVVQVLYEQELFLDFLIQ